MKKTATLTISILLLMAILSACSSNKTIQEDTTKQTESTLTQESTKESMSEQEFAKEFVTEYVVAIVEGPEKGLEDYISNENLLAYANKSIELTKEQITKGASSNLYSKNIEFEDVNIVTEELDDTIQKVKVPFVCEGSGQTCTILLEIKEDTMQVVDFYFTGMDSIDSIVTGHHTERKIGDPELWNDEAWVDSANEKLIQYEQELDAITD